MSTPFKVEPHNPTKMKNIPWTVCKSCGLVYLKNELTAWCIRNGCNAAEHPGYKSAVASLSKAKPALTILMPENQ